MKKLITLIILSATICISKGQEILPDFKHDCKTDTLIKSKIVISTQQARVLNACSILYNEQYILTKKVFDIVIYQDSLNNSLKNEIFILKKIDVLKDNEIKFHKDIIINKDLEINGLNKKLKYYNVYKYFSIVSTVIAVVLILK